MNIIITQLELIYKQKSNLFRPLFYENWTAREVCTIIVHIEIVDGMQKANILQKNMHRKIQ